MKDQDTARVETSFGRFIVGCAIGALVGAAVVAWLVLQ